MTLKYSYKIRSFFNASHAVRWENGIGQQHTHTWEVVCELSSSADKTVIFKEMKIPYIKSSRPFQVNF